MDEYLATKLAYLHGYEAGVKDMYDKIINSNNETYLQLVVELLNKQGIVEDKKD